MSMYKEMTVTFHWTPNQNKKSGLAKFALNGSLTEIGRGRDALYQDANKEIIGFYFAEAATSFE